MRLFPALAAVAFLAAANPALPQSSDEIALYQVIRSSNNVEELEVYLKSYPRGAFAEIVRKRIAAINDARAKEQAQKAESTKAADGGKREQDALQARLAAAPDPTADQIKAALASYYTARSFNLPAGGSIASVTWRDVKVFPKEIMLLSSANYYEYGRRKADIEVASWKVHVVVDIDIIESPSFRRMQHDDRDLRFHLNDAGELVYRWGG